MKRHFRPGMYYSVPIEQSDALGYGMRVKPRKAEDHPLTTSAHTARLMATYMLKHGRRPTSTELAENTGISITAMRARIRNAARDGFLKPFTYEPVWHLLPEHLREAS